MSNVRIVTIPATSQHEGFFAAQVRLHWVCPQCWQTRGEQFETVSYDGSRRLGGVHGWHNACGHVDYYADVLIEAQTNGLNGAQQ